MGWIEADVARSGQHARASPPRSTDYRPEIDGLRAVAVTAVIVHHFERSFFPNGYLGVDIFFVISGYVITASLTRQSEQSFVSFLANFYARRMRRLLPALVVCVLATAVIGALFVPPEATEFRSSIRSGIAALFGISNLYFFHQRLDYFGSIADLNLFTQTWSLGVEEQFYLVFPALFWIGACFYAGRRTLLMWIVLALFAASLAAFLLFFDAFPAGVYFLMPFRFWELAAGCLISLASANIVALAGRTRSMLLWAGAAALVAGLLIPAHHGKYATLLAVAGAAAIIATISSGSILYRLLTLRAVVTVGLLSYSLYLWHWSVISIGRWTIGIHGWSVPLLCALIVAIATLSYRAVERPFRAAKWSGSDVGTIGYALALLLVVLVPILLIAYPLKGTLYAGTPTTLTQSGIETLAMDRPLSDGSVWRARNCILSSDDEVGKSITWDDCVVGRRSAQGRKFLVIGDSFSTAQFEMFRALSEAEIGTVVVTSAWGASPVPEIPNNSQWAGANRHYWDSVVPSLIRHLNRGDVVLMVNDSHYLAPERREAKSQARLGLLKQGLTRMSRELSAQGIAIVFQTINPFLRDAGCTPDMAKQQWFNLGHTRCRYQSRVRSIERRSPVHATLLALEAANANFFVLDLFSVLCGGDVCRFSDEQGTVLYRDAYSHLSAAANEKAWPLLDQVVRRAMNWEQSMTGSAPAR